MSPSRQTMKNLATLAEQLNKGTDELNTVFTQVEQQIEATKIGVSAWLDDSNSLIDVETDEEEEEWLGWRVGYCKIADKWRLAAQRVKVRYMQDGRDRYADGDPIGVEDPIPLTNAPRLVRVEAAAQLDHILEAIAGRAKEFIDFIARAKETASTK